MVIWGYETRIMASSSLFPTHLRHRLAPIKTLLRSSRAQIDPAHVPLEGGSVQLRLFAQA